MLGDGRKHLACGKQLKFYPRDFTTRAGSHVIMFSVGRFTCKQRVRLLGARSGYCFV